MNEVISVTVQSDIYIDQEVENLRGLKKKNLSISIKMLKCMSGNILGKDILKLANYRNQ